MMSLRSLSPLSESFEAAGVADGAAEALYPHWLAAQMDLALGETARAANELQLYTSYVQEFAAWVRRKYMPVGGGRLMT